MDNYKGFCKVWERGGAYVTAGFYNPDTNEFFSTCVRDYDSRDKDELYHMQIDNAARRKYLIACGVPVEGMRVKVVRGRKFVGETKTVEEIYEFIPEACRGYGNRAAYAISYLRFTDGTRCAMHNCESADEAESPEQVSYRYVEEK